MSQQTGKDCLPNGWVVRVSSKFRDRIYYFNTLTGSSTWECPELVPRRFSNEKEGSAYKPTQKKSLDSQTNIAPRHSAGSSHTPVDFPPNKKSPPVNISKKRSLEIVTPTSSRTIHYPNEFSLHKPSTINIHNKNDLKRRQPETGGPSTSEAMKNARIPTAIVAPVIAGDEKTSTRVGNLSKAAKAKRKRRNRRQAMLGQARDLVPSAVAGPSIVQEMNAHKRLRTSPPVLESPPVQKERVIDPNKPSYNASTSNENVSTDSDMELEFGTSLNAVPSTSSEVAVPSTSSEVTTFPHNDNSLWFEVEMLDVSDLTNLDEIVPERDPNQLNSHYIVLDTNVLLYDIAHIEDIKETPLEGCGPPHFIIPWVVFQELDRLKTFNDGIAAFARKAIRYIFKILKSKHPRFHGQSGEEAHKLKRKYHDSNDDKIIDLCLSLRKKMSPEKVILMTNDKNLANKAMTYEVIVHDFTSFLENITPDIPIQNPSSKKKKPKKNEKDESIPSKMSKERLKLLNERSGYEKDMNLQMDDARQLLKNVLDPFLVQEMQKTYGSAWERFKIDRRLLREILAAYIKFWPTVFYAHFTSKAKNSFELLHQKATSPKGFNGTLEECLQVFHAIEDIFRAFIKVQPNLSPLMGNIQSLQDNFARIVSKCNIIDSSICEVESAITTGEENLVLEILNHNWNVVNEICGMVMDFYGVQHTFEYPKPETLPPESEYRRVVADLYPSLLQLKQYMKKVVEHVNNSTPSKPSFAKFTTALKELVPSLNVKSEMPNMNSMTTKSVEQFCRKPENRDKMQVGYQQLEHFCSKLSEAIQSMMVLKKNRPSLS